MQPEIEAEVEHEAVAEIDHSHHHEDTHKHEHHHEHEEEHGEEPAAESASSTHAHTAETMSVPIELLVAVLKRAGVLSSKFDGTFLFFSLFWGIFSNVCVCGAAGGILCVFGY